MTKPSGTFFREIDSLARLRSEGVIDHPERFTFTSTFTQFWKPKIEVLRE